MSHDKRAHMTHARTHHRDQALLASAFVLGGLILAQAARLPRGEARADVAVVGDITAINAQIAQGEDVVCVLDARSEQLMVYRVENRARVELAQVLKLSDAFAEAKGQGGRPRR